MKNNPEMSKNRYQAQRKNGKKDYLHRHIMEEFLGRPLEYMEHVYHINGDPKDNEIGNLVVIKKKQRKILAN